MNEFETSSGSSRRQFLASLSATCAALLSPEVLATGYSSYQRQAGGKKGTGQFLNASQLLDLASMSETIIPATETLGAIGMDTHGYIDDQLANCRSKKDAKAFVSALNQVMKKVKSKWKAPYSKLSAENQHSAMSALANASSPFDQDDHGFFRQLKGLTLSGYYSSEEGASRELVYLPVPGGFDGNFTVADNNGKAFAPPHL